MSKYLPLFSPCPVSGCGDKTVYRWVHAGCGSQTELNSDGKLRCSSHTYSEYWIFDWLFQCKTYSNEFKAVDQSKLITALALISEYQKDEHRDWAEKLMDNLTIERMKRRVK
jgi:hypothetical protein